MKKRIIVLSILIATLLSGCGSSISQEDYDSKVAELEKVQKELTELKTQNAEKGMSEAGAKAWATESFGEAAQIIIHDKDLYINVPTGFTVSEKSIEALWTKILSGLSLYADYYKMNPEQLPYDSVTIIVLEEETGLDMLSCQFLKNADGSFTQNAAMINISDFNKIAPYLSKAIK
nr:hypothetical protein [uncultured Schaedlerella sp.]